MKCEFQRIAIVNRGEAAMRMIHAAREFNLEFCDSLRTIALFSDADRDATFVCEADEAVSIGSSHFVDPATHRSKSSYHDRLRLEQALTNARADAVWPGWRMLAGSADLAELCAELGIVFIGPDAATIRQFTDKIAAKRLAIQNRIPVAPWSEGAIENLVDARHHAARLGYPLLLKATAANTGEGIRVVNSPIELDSAFEDLRAQAFAAFGDPTLFLERLLPGVRKIEVDVVCDLFGAAWPLAVRECTLCVEDAAILSQSPAPSLSPKQETYVQEMAVRITRAASFSSVGTIRFLFQPATGNFFFLGMTPALPAEHALTEVSTGLDAVKLQIQVAKGARLAAPPTRNVMHAVQVVLHAINSGTGVARVERLKIPTIPGVRVDTPLAEGDVFQPEFDSTLARITACGSNRKEAFSRVHSALRNSVAIVESLKDNKNLLLDILQQPEVQDRGINVEWPRPFTTCTASIDTQYADVALLAGAIETYNAAFAVEKDQFYASAARLRPSVRNEIGRNVELRYRGQTYSLSVHRIGLNQYRVGMNGATFDLCLHRKDRYEYWLKVSGSRFHVVCHAEDLDFRIEVDGVSHQVNRTDGGLVCAPAPAVIVSIAVRPGDSVVTGQPLATLEAMKMEMPVLAPFSGIVRQITAIPNEQIDSGAALMQIERSAIAETATNLSRVVLGTSWHSDQPPVTMPSRCRQSLRELRQMVLGFDVDPSRILKLFSEWSRNCPADSAEIRNEEHEILGIFADLCYLFSRLPADGDFVSGESPSFETYLFSYLRMLEGGGSGLPQSFLNTLRAALAHYGVSKLDCTPELEDALFYIFKSHQRVEQQVAPIQSLLERRLRYAETATPDCEASFRTLLDRVISLSESLFPALTDMAREVRYRYFDKPLFEHARQQVYAHVDETLASLATETDAVGRRERMRALIECPQPVVGLFSARFSRANPIMRSLMLEVLTWRHYRIRDLLDLHSSTIDGHCYVSTEYDYEGKRLHVLTTYAEYGDLSQIVQATFPLISELPSDHDVMVDFYVWHQGHLADQEATQQEIHSLLNHANFPRSLRRIVVAVGSPGQDAGRMFFFTYRLKADVYEEEKFFRGIHPMMGKRLHLWRLSNFQIQRLPSVEDVYLLHAVSHSNPKDERLFACAEVRDLTPVRDDFGRVVQLPHLERMLMEAMASIRIFQSRRRPHERLYWNRIFLYIWPPLTISPEELQAILQRLAPATGGLGLEQLALRARIPNPETGELRDMIIRVSSPGGSELLITYRPDTLLQPIQPLSEYEQKVVRCRQRGLIYPYEIIKMLTPSAEDTSRPFPVGDFVEHDLDANGRLIPVERPYGKNKSNIIAGVIRNFTSRYPEGITRVLLLGDPGKDLGALAEPECRRIMAALDLAACMRVPLEWFAISAGAKISMESGVENMDWIARVLRRLVEFTQAGGEVNLIINGINVGAQPYWNAEATMLMHTRGILIMTTKAAMVLTGKRALDFSGGISAEDNIGIGGYDRIMGFNGQAQYWARDIEEASHILLQHYEHTYIAPGERFPRRAITTDPIDRNVQLYPHSNGQNDGFTLVGEIFSDETNSGRKKPFDIRRVMMAASDQDHPTLERWAGMRSAETAVVWDAHLGGFPVCLIGIESRLLPRLGFVPADGPEQWTSGTLFPLSSKKIARAINAASNNRPVVLLANLSGFDGSPESMRKLQLEYGAEIGRAVVNFKGPMIFCVISRYHGGAYVVFSQALNENLRVVALEGTYASVIGGAPAAAVVFAGDVDGRTRKDPRLQALTDAMATADGAEKARLRAQYDELFKLVHSEKLGQVATEFDQVHSVHRALKVGALSDIISPATLRPFLIHAIEHAISAETEPANSTMEPATANKLESAA